MKDIPVFTACGGTATLILREIAASTRAYVILQTHSSGQVLQQASACADFCRLVGAKEIYLSCRDGTPLPMQKSYTMEQYALPREQLPGIPVEQFGKLIPVTEALLTQFIDAYNLRFRSVLGAATMTKASYQASVGNGCRHYFALDDHGTQVGLGTVQGAQLCSVASLRPGWGAAVTASLLTQTAGDPVILTVSSVNHSALSLYQRLGFSKVETLSTWYTVI